MRAILLALAILLPSSLDAASNMKERCASFAHYTDAVVESSRQLLKALEEDPKSHTHPEQAPPAVRRAGKVAREARARYVEALTAYIRAAEDETYQLRVCAR